MAELVPDLFEQILIRLDAKNVIRFKSVCKSWKLLISSSRFIESHLNHSYNNDRSNNTFRDRRIVLSINPIIFCFEDGHGEFDDLDFDFRYCDLVGSSNGLVCTISFRVQFLVGNPLTREVKKLQNPQIPPKSRWSALCCWGFGYDSSTVDYKIVLGFIRNNGEEDLTCFQVLSLKSNVWKVVEVKYNICSKMGVLCNGALHWLTNDQNKKKVILSLDLSNEEFKEIPQPGDDTSYKFTFNSRLGIIKECLCIFGPYYLPYHGWVMKNYNVKQSWEQLPPALEVNNDAVHDLHIIKDYISYRRTFSLNAKWVTSSYRYIDSPIYVESLVSPHVCTTLKRKRNDDELIDGEP